MDLEQIRGRINAGADADEMRVALAEKIMECLEARGEDMSPVERSHFNIAIDLLPTSWLLLTWAHVDSVCNPSEADKGAPDLAPMESAPPKSELLAKLTEALALMHAQHNALAEPPGGPRPAT